MTDFGKIFTAIGDGSKLVIHFIRDSMTTGLTSMGQDATLIVPIIMLVISLFAGYWLIKKFTMTPFSGKYIGWFLIIVALIFMVLNYL